MPGDPLVSKRRLDVAHRGGNRGGAARAKIGVGGERRIIRLAGLSETLVVSLRIEVGRIPRFEEGRSATSVAMARRGAASLHRRLADRCRFG